MKLKKINIYSLLSCVFIINAHSNNYFAVASVSGGATYLVSEDFEGTGIPAGWAETGTGVEDYDDATAPSPLVGSQSLRVTVTASGTGRVESPNFTAISEIHGYFVMHSINAVDAGNTRKIVTLENSGGGTAEGIILSGGDLILTHGGSSADVETPIADDTTVHIWFRWKAKVGAADGEAELAWSTDGIKPTSGLQHQLITDGSGSGTAMRSIAIGVAVDDGAVANWTIIYDKVRVDDAVIGDNPS